MCASLTGGETKLPRIANNTARRDQPTDGSNIRGPKKGTAHFRFRLESCLDKVFQFPIDPSQIRPSCYRDFEIPDCTTLEQLSSVILSILGWNEDHLFEFRLQNRSHVQFGDDAFVVDSPEPCISCVVSIRELGIGIGDRFAYIFDFGDRHTLVVSDIQPFTGEFECASLIAHKGSDILQYPHLKKKKGANTLLANPLSIGPITRSLNRKLIRFISL